MASSGEIRILTNIASLADRFGVHPAIADVELDAHYPEMGQFYYTLRGVEGSTGDPEEHQKVKKVWSLLGLDPSGFRRFSNLSEVADVVDSALAAAPRSRIR